MSIELLTVFLKGMAVGFVGAVPLGPLGAICIRRTLQQGFVAAIVGGLGTAFADAIFAIISAFGLTVIANFLKNMETPLRVIGGVFMLAIGWYVLSREPRESKVLEASASSASHMGNLVSNFFLTVTNPLAIVFFTMAFASLGIAGNESFVKAAIVVVGVFSGSMTSWILLAGVINLKRNSKMLSDMKWVNRVTATALIACGVWALAILLPK